MTTGAETRFRSIEKLFTKTKRNKKKGTWILTVNERVDVVALILAFSDPWVKAIFLLTAVSGNSSITVVWKFEFVWNFNWGNNIRVALRWLVTETTYFRLSVAALNLIRIGWAESSS